MKISAARLFCGSLVLTLSTVALPPLRAAPDETAPTPRPPWYQRLVHRSRAVVGYDPVPPAKYLTTVGPARCSFIVDRLRCFHADRNLPPPLPHRPHRTLW